MQASPRPNPTRRSSATSRGDRREDPRSARGCLIVILPPTRRGSAPLASLASLASPPLAARDQPPSPGAARRARPMASPALRARRVARRRTRVPRGPGSLAGPRGTARTPAFAFGSLRPAASAEARAELAAGCGLASQRLRSPAAHSVPAGPNTSPQALRSASPRCAPAGALDAPALALLAAARRAELEHPRSACVRFAHSGPPGPAGRFGRLRLPTPPAGASDLFGITCEE